MWQKIPIWFSKLSFLSIGSIWPVDENLKGTTSPCHSGHGSYSNKEWLYILQTPEIDPHHRMRFIKRFSSRYIFMWQKIPIWFSKLSFLSIGSIWPVDENLKGTTSPCHSGHGSYSNKEWLYILQTPEIDPHHRMKFRVIPISSEYLLIYLC